MNMKVVILCGGDGIRLKESPEFIPKALIPISGSPIIYSIMVHFSFYGLNDFILCIDSKGHMIKSYFNNKNLPKKERENISRWNISFSNTGDNIGTGARIFKSKEHVGNQDFMVTYSDIITDVNLSRLLQFHRAMGRILTITGAHLTTPLGIIRHEDGLVLDYKKQETMSSTVKGGYFVCKPKIFNYLSGDPSCVFEEEPMDKLISEKQAALYDYKGFWKHFDSYKHIDEMDKLNKEDYPSWKIQ